MVCEQGLQALSFMRRGLPSVSQAIRYGQRPGHTPGILNVKVVCRVVGVAVDVGQKREGLEISVTRPNQVDVIYDSEGADIQRIPAAKFGRNDAACGNSSAARP